MKNILAIIPARSGSKGIPQKNIKLLGGKRLLEYTFEHCKSSSYISRAIVTTDSNKIANISKSNGIEVPFIRPRNISDDDSTAKSYVSHALEFLEREENYTPEIILILQPTSPFRDVSDIEKSINILENNNADSVVSITEIDKKFNPDWQFKVTNNGTLEFYNKNFDWNNLVSKRQELAKTYTRNGAVYCFTRKSFFKYDNIYGKKVLCHIMPRSRSINLDTFDDWIEAENYLTKRYRQ